MPPYQITKGSHVARGETSHQFSVSAFVICHGRDSTLRPCQEHASLYDFRAFKFNQEFFKKNRRLELVQSVKGMTVKGSGTTYERHEQID